MGTMSRMAVVCALAALSGMVAQSVPPAVMQAAESATRQFASPWRSKLRNTRTTVAAMKRHARKRRNVRARSSKRGSA